jgi:hypothetical protein
MNTRSIQANMANWKTCWTSQFRRRMIDILLEGPVEVQAVEDEISEKDLGVTDTMKEIILEERRKEAIPAGETKDKEGEQAFEDEATGEREGERLRRRQLLQDEYNGLQLRVDAMRARQRDITAELEKQI